jgi:DNA segregation ATPase FtsK/SpoIIIE-like protein
MYVYWWHVSGLRAVKVGHASDPSQYVSDYRSEHRLSGQDLRGYRLDSSTDAAWVERQLCRLLETKGFQRITLQLGEGEEKFYALGSHTFEDVHELLRDVAHHIALAEESNQRRQQMRREAELAEERSAQRQDQDTDQVQEVRPPRRQRTSAPSMFPATGRRWLYPIGAIVALSLMVGLKVGLEDDDLAPGPGSANLAVQNPSAAGAPRESHASGGPPPGCSLEELGETLIHVSCAGSWARMRWTDRWVLDDGHNESDALGFFKASDTARKAIASPSPKPAPQVPEQAKVEPEGSPQSNQPATPAAPPPQPRPPQAVPRPAAAQQQQQEQPPPQPRPPQAVPRPAAAQQQQQEQPPPRPRPPQAESRPAAAQQQEEGPPLKASRQCRVSRPKPGFQVYLVTCPNSQATIGRTVDLPTGWTVSEGVNETEAVEFFMKSRYAR